MDNNEHRLLLRLLVILLLNAACGVAHAQSDTSSSDNSASVTEEPREYSKRGADTCLKCHDEDSEFPVLAIFQTRHATVADERTPFADLQCEACHGPVGEHGKRRIREGEQRQPIVNFKARSGAALDQYNRVCLGCHQGGKRIEWQGSHHERVDIACVDCHTVHVRQDKVLLRIEQPAVCYKCHTRTRAEFFRPSIHPVRFGQLACSECHSTHGSMTAGLLLKPTLNQTCYTCHAEKRGPLLWEHAPVPENCALCHLPHGSMHQGLLTQRPPLLCQRCHSQLGHPSVAHGSDGLAGAGNSAFLLGASCLNCHSQVHGSNHPSGAKLMR